MRAASAILAAAVLVALVAACGGGRRSTTSTQAGGALAYSHCMRTHGVSQFPDPNASGDIDKAKLIPLLGRPAFQTAQTACRHLLPQRTTRASTQAEVQAALRGMVRFAACMRSNGVQDWPDPDVDRTHPGDPRPVFDLADRIDPYVPRIKADMQACEHLMPQSTPPYVCSRAAAERVPGSPPDAEGCGGGSPRVP